MKRYKITDERYQKFSITARGLDFDITIYYVNYSDAWFMDISTQDGQKIIMGERMVSGLDIGFKFDFKGVYILDKNGNARDPKSDGWNDLYLVVLSEDELQEQERVSIPEPTYLIDASSNPLVDNTGFYLTV